MGTRTEGIFEMESMAMDNAWLPYTLQNANLYIFQHREGSVDINVSHNRSGMGYFTIKAGQSLPLSSFSTDVGGETQVLYFRAASGTLEILKQKRT